MRGADLSVKPRDADALARLARRAAGIGIGIIGADYEIAEAVGREVSGVRVVPRYTVRAASRREARRLLDRAPRGVIVVLEAEGLDALRYGGVSKRVDVVRPGPGLEYYAVDDSQARLFRERGWGAVEVSLAPLTRRGGRDAWRRFLITVKRAFSNGVEIVLVSDAEDELGLWSPYSMAGLLRLAGIPDDRALAAVFNGPLRVLKRAGLA